MNLDLWMLVLTALPSLFVAIRGYLRIRNDRERAIRSETAARNIRIRYKEDEIEILVDDVPLTVKSGEVGFSNLKRLNEEILDISHQGQETSTEK